MIVFEHIKRLVECISYEFNKQPITNESDVETISESIGRQYTDISNSIRDKYLPLLQYNFDVQSLDEAKQVFGRISENVNNKTYVSYLPDGFHTRDEIGDLIIETPSIVRWQHQGTDNSLNRQNFVIDYRYVCEDFGKDILNQLVVNMLLSLPSGSFRLHFVDLTFSAQASYLTRNLDSRLYNKTISTTNDWHQLIDELREKMVKSLEYGDVVSYNLSKQKVEIPYDVVVITNYQKCLDEIRDIDTLFENGYRGGIYFILMNNQNDMPEEDGKENSLLFFNDSYWILDVYNNLTLNTGSFIRCTPILHNPFLEKACFEYINKGAEFSQVALASVDYGKMTETGFVPIEKSMFFPVGSTDKGDLVDFTLDTVSHIHCFIIGQSGMGKSVFLHDVIVGVTSKYSPEELELYLMDFKNGGVEFNHYRNEKHVKALLVDNSDIQITLEILREINNKMRERGKLLRSSGVSNIVDYNKINPDKKMPRIMFIADECHVMFPTMSSKDARLYREISDILAKIAKEGRSQGVHLVLATQTIAQADIPSEVINNISDFYLLKCAPGDSERLVRGSVETTSQLKVGQVLHHDIDNDVVFTSSYLELEALKGVIKKINDKAKPFMNEQLYFDGSQVFEIDDEVKSLLVKNGNALALGRSIDTKLEPVIISLRNEYGDNVMLFGINDEEQVSRTTMASIQSLRISNKGIKVKVINCLPTDQKNTTNMLKSLAEKGEIELLNPSRCGTELVNIATSIKNRDAEQMVLYILGQERFRELRMDMEIETDKPASEADDFGFDSSIFSSGGDSGDAAFNSYQKVIEYILKNGAEVGVHVIMQIDKPKQLLFADYMSAKDFFNMFHHLIMLKCDDNAVTTLGLSDDLRLENLSSDIERLRAIYYNETNNSYTLFTPFDF